MKYQGTKHMEYHENVFQKLKILRKNLHETSFEQLHFSLHLCISETYLNASVFANA